MANTTSDPPFKVKALFEYSSPHEDDLNFPADEVITVTAIEDDDWYYGEYVDKASGEKREGIFPMNFVERIVVELPPRPARSAGGRKKTIEGHAQAPLHQEPPPAEPEHEEAVSPVAAPPPPAPAALRSPVEEPVAPPAPALSPAETRPSPPLPPPTEEPKAVPKPVEQPRAPPASPPKAAASGNKPPPPEKPSSFKDRLAMFNKGGAAPIAPFNPQKPAQTFIKKPYVAPPPSRNAYVPPPIAPQPKPKRDEETGAHPPPPPREEPARISGESPREDREEEKPKLGLKDRIALLQTQQLEVGGKPKPRPKPKRAPPSQEPPADEDVASPESAEGGHGRKSHDVSRPENLEGEEASEEAPPRPKRSVDIRREEPQYEDSSAGEADISSIGDEARVPHHRPVVPHREDKSDDGDDEGANEDTPDAPDTTEGEEDAEEEEEVDPEVARKLALRERMAKMSGGMGMHGMFGPPMGIPMGGGLPKKKSAAPKKSTEEERPRRSHDGNEDTSPESARPVPIPVFPMMPKSQPPPEVELAASDTEEEQTSVPAGESISEEHDRDEEVDIEDMKPTHPERPHGPRPMPTSPPIIPADRPAPPPVGSERPPPPPPPVESRPPPPPPAAVYSQSEGSESDDEMSRDPSKLSLDTSGQPHAAPPPPPPAAVATPSSPSKRQSQSLFSHPTSPSSSPGTPASNKRTSYRGGGVPPIPAGITSPGTTRPPPPPPASAPPPPRRSMDERSEGGNMYGQPDAEEEVTEYEADYDTDMANKVRHRDALTAQHGKEPETIDDEDETPLPSPTISSPPMPARSVPPPPPPPGTGPPPPSRKSMDMSRMPPVPMSPPQAFPPARKSLETSRIGVGAPPPAPPPVPPPQAPPAAGGDDEYDPYKYESPRRTSPAPPAQQYAPPPPPPPSQAPFSPEGRAQSRGSGRPSADISRTPGGTRRSIDQSRPQHNDFIARDIDLAPQSLWYTQANTLPPALQPRLRDIAFEIEETSQRSRGGRTTISKEVYILFHDYSQTVITARFDRDDPNTANVEQRHEAPPAQPRQDMLEEFQAAFGGKIFSNAKSKENTVVGDGDPVSFVKELFSQVPDALPPVGTRSYGCLVYANLANASVQHHDEIRPGDIITFRNARFQGHKGGLHAKYSVDVGKPDHVAVVVDWDGTKKKIRAFEQGRESKKVKIESFKIGDLKSGEVKVWRVAGRGWVGWDAQGS